MCYQFSIVYSVKYLKKILKYVPNPFAKFYKRYKNITISHRIIYEPFSFQVLNDGANKY